MTRAAQYWTTYIIAAVALMAIFIALTLIANPAPAPNGANNALSLIAGMCAGYTISRIARGLGWLMTGYHESTDSTEALR